jgi:hypothetical protein
MGGTLIPAFTPAPAGGTRPMRNGWLPAGRTGHGEGFHGPPRCLRYGILSDQHGPHLPDAGLGRVQLAADGAEMGAEFAKVLLEPLLLELRRVPDELELIELELIELTLGFRDATPELLYVAFQAVALVVQLTEADGQPVDSPGQFLRRSRFRRALGNALTTTAKPGHWLTLAP